MSLDEATRKAIVSQALTLSNDPNKATITLTEALNYLTNIEKRIRNIEKVLGIRE